MMTWIWVVVGYRCYVYDIQADDVQMIAVEKVTTVESQKKNGAGRSSAAAATAGDGGGGPNALRNLLMPVIRSIVVIDRSG